MGPRVHPESEVGEVGGCLGLITWATDEVLEPWDIESHSGGGRKADGGR